MGGPGSGRWKDRRRKTVESCWMLDINQLSGMGCLRPGWSSACKWAYGNDGAQSTYTEAGDCISPIPCRSGENGKTWLRSSPSSMPVVGSAAVAPVSLALDLKNGTHCSFPLGQSAAFLSVQPPWFLRNQKNPIIYTTPGGRNALSRATYLQWTAAPWGCRRGRFFFVLQERKTP